MKNKDTKILADDLIRRVDDDNGERGHPIRRTQILAEKLNNHQLKLVGWSYGLKSGYGSKTR